VTQESFRAHVRRVSVLALTASVLGVACALAGEKSYHDVRFEALSRQVMETREPGRRAVLLQRIFDIRTEVFDPHTVQAFLFRVADDDGATHILRDQALWLASEMALESGDLATTAQIRDKLGLVDNWAVIGPFDNTAKAGFDVPYPPENELDFNTSYAGKTPFVRWRGIPLENPIGYVDFEELFRPNENATGYAVTFAHVEDRTPVAVRLGADDVAKVFVNGRLALSKEGYNHVALDQVSAGVVLERGWNEILVKVCQVDERWGFYLRLSAPRGGTVPGMRLAASFEEIRKAAAESAQSERLESVPVADLTSMLRARQSSEPPTAGANFELGYYLAVTSNFDRDRQEQAGFLARAVELEPDNVEYLKALARFGASPSQRQRALRRAAASAPDDPDVLTRLADAFADRDFTPDAIRTYNKALALDGRFAPAHVGSARLLMRELRYAQALERLESAASTSPGNPETALLSAIIYQQLELPEKARGAFLLALGRMAPISGVNRPYISLLVEANRNDEALERYDFLLAVEPLVSAYYRDKGSLLWRLGRRDEALAVTREALSVAPEDDKTLDQLARFLFETGHLDKARAHWTKALVLKPQNARIREQLDVLARQNSAPEELAARPFAEVAASAADLDDWSSEYDTGAVYLIDIESVNVVDDLIANRFFQQTVLITDKRASDDFRYFPIYYTPSSQQVTVRAMDVVRPDGSRLRANYAGERGMSDPQYNLYYDHRARIYVFPELQAHDMLDIQYVVRDLSETNPFEGYFGDVKVFTGSHPVLKQEYVLQWPKDVTLFCQLDNSLPEPVMVHGNPDRLQLLQAASPQAAEEPAESNAESPNAAVQENEYDAPDDRFEPVADSKNVAVWSAGRLEALRREPFRPGQTELSPYLTVSTFSNWPELIDWYSRLVREQFVVSDQTADEIMAIVEPLATLEEKVAAVHDFVITNTRYVGLEFGVHGYKPYKSRNVLARRFGDCKDKAALAVTLFRRCGIPARMVVLRTRMRGRISLAVPALALFDHAIVAVPTVDNPTRAEDYIWVDETAELTTYLELPAMDHGANTVVMDPFAGQGHLVDTPMAKSSDNRNRTEYTVEIAPDLSARIARTSSYVGELAPAVRRLAQDVKRNEKQFERSFNSYYPRARIADFKVIGIAGLREAPTLEMAFDVPDLVDARKMELASSLVPLDIVNRYASLQSRTYPVDLRHPWMQTMTVHYDLPDNLEFADIPDNYESETGVGSFAISYVRRSPRSLVVAITVTLAKARMPADEYPVLRKFAWDVDEHLKSPITLRMSE